MKFLNNVWYTSERSLAHFIACNSSHDAHDEAYYWLWWPVQDTIGHMCDHWSINKWVSMHREIKRKQP